MSLKIDGNPDTRPNEGFGDPERAPSETLDFRVNSEDYWILTKRDDHKSPEYALSSLVNKTDQLIGRLDGSLRLDHGERAYGMDQRTLKAEPLPSGEVAELGRPDLAVYLDKSTRPVEWMTRDFWDLLATPGTDGSAPQMPESRFMNIDRVPWLRRMGVAEDRLDSAGAGAFEVSEMAKTPGGRKDILGRIRLLFVADYRPTDGDSVRLTEENWREEVWKMPLRRTRDAEGNLVEPRHIMAVDEMRVSGATLGISQKLLASALPEVAVSGYHWATLKLEGTGMVKGELQKRQKNAVPWYSEGTEGGRGIGAGQKEKWFRRYSQNWRTREAAIVLSTPPLDAAGAQRMDQASKLLRLEISQLRNDVEFHRVLYKPAPQRPDARERIKRIDGIDFETWKRVRDAQDSL